MEKITRKVFLKRLAVAGIGAPLAASWLAACGGAETTETTNEAPVTTAKPENPAEAEAMASDLPADACDDVSGLTESELTNRQNQNYVAQSPKEGQYCSNCRFWQPGANEGGCGGCTVIKGPIHPQGWCNLWNAKPS